MKTLAEKTVKPAHVVQRKTIAGPSLFTSNEAESRFFGPSPNTSIASPAQISSFVQAKLTISQPGDPYEKEADAMAEKVMRMPEPAMSLTPVNPSKQEELQRSEEREEEIQAKPLSSEITPIQRVPEQEELQTQAEEQEELIQAHPISDKQEEPIQAKLQPFLQRKEEEEDQVQAKTDRSALNSGSIRGPTKYNQPSPSVAFLQRKSRGPPEIFGSFEQNLYDSKGKGSVLPSDTRTFMESRFSADFSQVRVHTDLNAAKLTAGIGAKAFAHGADIYFGAGRFQPKTADGGSLLAHELTHTVQQGAARTLQPKLQLQPLRAGSQIQPATGFGTRENPSPFNQRDEFSGDSSIAESGFAGNTPATGPSPGLSTGSSASTNNTLGPAEAGGTTTVDPEIASGEADSMQKAVVEKARGGIQIPAISISPIAGNPVQGDWLNDVLSFVEDNINSIPGWRLFTFIMGYDPVRGENVPRTASNLLGALLGLIPVFGNLIFEKLQEYQILQRAFDWVDGELTRLNITWDRIRRIFSDAYDEMGVLDLISFNLEPFTRRLRGLYDDVVAFASSVADQVFNFIKEALLTVLRNTVAQIPGYTLLTKIIGQDPVSGQEVHATTEEILGDFLILIGREEEKRQMEERGTLRRTADWIDTQLGRFTRLLSLLSNLYTTIWNAFSFESLRDPLGVVQGIVNDFTTFVGEVLSFAYDVAITVLQYIKDALLGFLRENAAHIPGYTLMSVILGRDPFTQQAVERNAVNIIRGFMGLMPGGEAQFQQMQETGAIDRIANWIESTIERFGITWEFIRNLFLSLWNAFTIQDLIQPVEAFTRIIAQFREPIGRLVGFLIEVIRKIIEVILEVMNFPTDLIGQIINNAMQAYEDIKRDPIAFFLNLLRAVKQGFLQFFDNIGTHLLNGLIGWLLSELRDANVPAPQDFSLRGIIAWVLEVLGISMERIWEKLAQHPRIGPERVARIRGMIDRLEGIWTFIRDVQERGMAAIWEMIQEQLSNLWNTVLDAIKNWIMERIVNQIVARLLSMLDPTGIMAVVNSFIAFYRAVQSFIEKLREILQVINSFVQGVAEIARGVVSTAADFLEGAMARAMPVIIGFLANQVGLRGLGRRIGEMITRAREMVDNALTWLVNRAVNMALNVIDRLMAMGRSAVGAVAGWLGLRKNFQDNDGAEHQVYFEGEGNNAELVVESDPKRISRFLSDKANEFNSLPANDPKKIALENARAKNTELRTELNRLNNASASSQSQSQAMATNQNQTEYDTVNRIVDELIPLLRQLVTGPREYPPAILPPFANNVMPASFKAHYISKRRINRYAETNVNQHRGNLVGWNVIQNAGLTAGGENWVRMHLLTARLNGEPTDSNLVPARGQLNTGVMLPLENAADIAVQQENKTIWYEVNISMQSMNVPPTLLPPGTSSTSVSFLSRVQANWGTYDDNNINQEIPQTAVAQVNTTVNPPTLSGPVIRDIHDVGEPFLVTNIPNISPSSARYLALAIRTMIATGERAGNLNDLETKLNNLPSNSLDISAIKADIQSVVGTLIRF